MFSFFSRLVPSFFCLFHRNLLKFIERNEKKEREKYNLFIYVFITRELLNCKDLFWLDSFQYQNWLYGVCIGLLHFSMVFVWWMWYNAFRVTEKDEETTVCLFIVVERRTFSSLKRWERKFMVKRNHLK